jgi:hypothetical protein
VVWQSLRASVWALLTSPVKLSIAIYKLFGFLVKATLYFLIFSIASCLFIYAFAADDYVSAKPTTSEVGICGSSKVGPPTLTGVNGIDKCVASAISYYQSIQFGVASQQSRSDGVLLTLVSAYSTIYNLITFKKTGSEDSYSCPPDGAPDYTVGPMDLNGQKVCYKRTCTSSNNWFSNSMELGTGSACSFGCKYTVTASYQSATGPNAFIGKGNGDTCTCPAGSTQCWQVRTPNTEGDNDDTGTCYAWDVGEVKGVDCGKNGQMQVDLGPINDSLTAQSQSIADLQTNDAKQNTAIDWNTNQIAGLKVDVEALKKQGCSVSQTTNGVSISCNGTTATAMNGKDGAPGEKGADGVNGARGQDGAPGEKGETGATGATGETGAQGEKGEAGADGKDGEDGAAGATGAQGAQGIQGIQGVAGVSGAAGRDGIDGKDGEDGEDGEGLTAVQDGDDVGIMSASTGARLATLKGIDKDGIVSELQKSNTTLTDIDDKLEDLASPDAPTEVNADYGDKFAIKDPARTYSSVLSEHVAQMKGTQMFQALSGFFSVSFNGDCSPINFNFTVFSQAFDIAIDPFCNLTIWPYIRGVVMCVFGFFAFRVGFDN